MMTDINKITDIHEAVKARCEQFADYFEQKDVFNMVENYYTEAPRLYGDMGFLTEGGSFDLDNKEDIRGFFQATVDAVASCSFVTQYIECDGAVASEIGQVHLSPKGDEDNIQKLQYNVVWKYSEALGWRTQVSFFYLIRPWDNV